MHLNTHQPQALIAPDRLAKADRAPRFALHPLESVTRTHVTTAEAAHYLNRQPQTLRAWASSESWPSPMQPIRINGRLGWPVAGLKTLLGVQ